MPRNDSYYCPASAGAERVALVLVVALFLSTHYTVADGATTTNCDCGYGRVNSNASTSSKCICVCNLGYVLPNCIYKTSEQAKVILLLNCSSDQFLSNTLMDGILLGLGLPKTSNAVYFRGLASSSDLKTSLCISTTYCFAVEIGINGTLLNQFLNDVAARTAPYILDTMGGILDAKMNLDVVPLPDNVGAGIVVGTVKGANISLNTLGWIFGAVAMLVIICIEGAVFNVHQNEEEIHQEAMRDEMMKRHLDTDADHISIVPSPAGEAPGDFTEEHVGAMGSSPRNVLRGPEKEETQVMDA